VFDDLRAAFREALDNFNNELRRENVSETTDRLLLGMKNEIADEKVQLKELESQLDTAVASSERERDLGATCRRREKMARTIGDDETADLAAQHAAKHEGHHTLLEKKAVAIREEIEFRRRNVDEMIDKFSEAKERRDALSATAGRTGARKSFSDADDLFSELDRMAEKIEGKHRHEDAAEALDALERDLDSAAGDDLGHDLDHEYDYDTGPEEAPPAPVREELDVDAALAELKRRMGQS
jgi:phage shock protein A